MSDQHINCSECGGSFVFTDSERQFYETKGLSGPPKRCKTCRQARKAADPGRSGGFRARGPGGPGAPGNAPTGAPVPRGGWGRMGGDTARGPSRDGGSFSGGGFRDRGPARSDNGFGRNSGPGARTGAPAVTPGFGGPPRPGGTERPRAARPERPRYGDAAPRAERPRFGDARRESRNDARAEPRKAPSGSPPAASPANGRPKKAKAERPKFDVTCMQCGTTAQVPFRPIEGRDVFCQPCYQARRGPAPTPGAPALGTAEPAALALADVASQAPADAAEHEAEPVS